MNENKIHSFNDMTNTLLCQVNQNALAFITGQKDLDKDWEAYGKGLDDLNLAGYLEAM